MKASKVAGGLDVILHLGTECTEEERAAFDLR